MDIFGLREYILDAYGVGVCLRFVRATDAARGVREFPRFIRGGGDLRRIFRIFVPKL